MQAQEPCWFTVPPTCKDPNFVYTAGKGAGSAERNRNLAEAEAIRRYVAEVRGVQLSDATYKEIVEKGVENAKIEGIPVQYRVVRQKFENNNYYILLLLPRRFSADPRNIIYPEEELCDPRLGLAKAAELAKVGENISLKISSEKLSKLEIVTPADGNLIITLESFAEHTYVALYNEDGASLQFINKDIVSGQSQPNKFYSTKIDQLFNYWSDKVASCTWSRATEKFKGSFTFKLDAGTYYLCLIRSETGLSNANLSIQFKAMR